MSWVPKIKYYVRDPSKPMDIQYMELEAHHEKETNLMLARINELTTALKGVVTNRPTPEGVACYCAPAIGNEPHCCGPEWCRKMATVLGEV